ncbi:MAG: DUF4136 domain-containing protein [Deltaproteobacteria bacterium]|nr:DUF4136 domain-containing protein [Deltaproteobacteria bacterium]
MRSSWARIFLWPAIAVVLTLAGCATTEIVNQWSHPEYRSLGFKKILVIGVSKQTSIRRSFEDEFVAQLKGAGVNAVSSYQFIKEDGPVEEPRLQEAVKHAGADAALITRLLRVEQRTQVTPGYYEPFPVYGFYRWYSHAWHRYYEPPRVYHYEVYTSETSLYDMRKNQVVWSGTVETTGSGDIKKDIRSYVQVVLKELKQKRFLEPVSL